MIVGFFGDYRWLSNFWPAETPYEGVVYPTSEHAYQAAKTNDTWERLKIKALKTPAEAKKAGAKLPWNDNFNKLFVMYQVVSNKFKNNPVLREKLLETYPHKLIEDNTWGDKFWGVCRGEGLNYLGKILMRVRKDLKNVTAM